MKEPTMQQIEQYAVLTGIIPEGAQLHPDWIPPLVKQFKAVLAVAQGIQIPEYIGSTQLPDPWDDRSEGIWLDNATQKVLYSLPPRTALFVLRPEK